ncbi:hypothetical protein GFS60_00017 [Rhodococcus sp. WAY2]|nr:hypothetical protein GFS60_00017 [Rhodococcus sp. WAY2]
MPRSLRRQRCVSHELLLLLGLTSPRGRVVLHDVTQPPESIGAGQLER